MRKLLLAALTLAFAPFLFASGTDNAMFRLGDDLYRRGKYGEAIEMKGPRIDRSAPPAYVIALPRPESGRRRSSPLARKMAALMKDQGHDVLLVCQEPHPGRFGFVDAFGPVGPEGPGALTPTGAGIGAERRGGPSDRA